MVGLLLINLLWSSTLYIFLHLNLITILSERGCFLSVHQFVYEKTEIEGYLSQPVDVKKQKDMLTAQKLYCQGKDGRNFINENVMNKNILLY